jgi:uncharacterized protein YndB with AHSA1/START domain
MLVSRHIHIAAPVERVFALMCDPAARAQLNPLVTPLRVEIENDSWLHQGSICYFRVQIGQRILDYRTRVQEFVPQQRIVSISDTAVPFEVAIETVADNGGTRLTQTERFEPTEDMLLAAGDGAGSRLARLVQRTLSWIDSDYAVSERERQEQRLRDKLEANLAEWLNSIRLHLEAAGR